MNFKSVSPTGLYRMLPNIILQNNRTGDEQMTIKPELKDIIAERRNEIDTLMNDYKYGTAMDKIEELVDIIINY